MTLRVCSSCQRHHRDEADGRCPFCTAPVVVGPPHLRAAWVPLAAAIALAACHQEDEGKRAVAVYGGPAPPKLAQDAGGDPVRNAAPAYGLAPAPRLTAPDAGSPTPLPERPDGGR